MISIKPFFSVGPNQRTILLALAGMLLLAAPGIYRYVTLPPSAGPDRGAPGQPRTPRTVPPLEPIAAFDKLDTKPLPPRSQLPSSGDPLRPLNPRQTRRVDRTLRVDLNAANETELRSINGIGPVLAGRILRHRSRRGPFPSLDALQEISGIGPATLDRLRPQVRLGDRVPTPPDTGPETRAGPTRSPPGEPRRVNVNRAGPVRLRTLPGIDRATAMNLIKTRLETGGFRNLRDLEAVQGIDERTLSLLEGRIRLGRNSP